MKQLSIAQCYANLTYWNTSYDKEEYLAYHLLHEYTLSQYECIPSLTAVKMLAIFINNYFVEKVEAPVVFFSVIEYSV
jgi:hypothetical protein